MEVDFTSPFASEQLKAMQSLMLVMDPELGINIIDMGLVYGFDFTKSDKLQIQMTLTTPYCPMAGSITQAVQKSMEKTFPDRVIILELVWQPEWSPDLMTEAGREQLNRQ
ncbi:MULTISPECIES: metal-sulfur cluster assembly factor [unclassified Sphingobacterium]|uniref:metal-sulfur cluster assembly factor n=1 Tax=unclassified Sphingobacterium TaxID=2609468 RepID=UPI0020C309C8|nr:MULTISPECIES: metal-sulfur cluster assembly factor [unclassified Sphingobacterium]